MKIKTILLLLAALAGLAAVAYYFMKPRNPHNLAADALDGKHDSPPIDAVLQSITDPYDTPPNDSLADRWAAGAVIYGPNRN